MSLSESVTRGGQKGLPDSANSHQSGINSPKTEAAVAPPAQTNDATEQDPEARQTEEDNAIAFVDAVEASILVDRAVDKLENVD